VAWKASAVLGAVRIASFDDQQTSRPTSRAGHPFGDGTPRTPDRAAMADRPAAKPALIVQVDGFYVGPRTTCDAAGVLRLMSSRLDPAAVSDRRENDWGPAGGVADGSRSKSQTVLKIRVDEVSVIAGVKADRVVERSVPQ
jgi:hypothetical protein